MILSTSFGAGHVRAAEALKEACRGLDPDGRVEIVDFLRTFNRYLSRVAEEAYYAMTKHTPRMYKFFYEVESKSAARLVRVETRLGRGMLLRILEEIQPDCVISTHFLPAGVLDRLGERVKVPQGVVLTDYESHPLWLYPGVDAYFVAHSGMRKELVAAGVQPERIHVTGIPIKAEFGAVRDREEVWRRLLTRHDLPLVLVASGGRGIGPLLEVLEALDQVEVPVQAAVVAGRNPVMVRRLRDFARGLRVPTQVLGFVENLHEWMSIAELMIGKAGGLSVSEAIAAHLPMVIVRPTPGQEEGNTNYLTWHGAAVHVPDLADLGAALNLLLSTPERLADMRRAAARIARPTAAREVVQTMLRLVRRRIPPGEESSAL
ncbi:MAG: glycosyltransferase [Bacillota bacterium]|nr:glycosyltransferase [Bacillota bacterium]